VRGDMSSSIQCIFWTSSARKSSWRVLQGAHAGGTAVWAHMSTGSTSWFRSGSHARFESKTRSQSQSFFKTAMVCTDQFPDLWFPYRYGGESRQCVTFPRGNV
jgi:hypothetical protein